MMGDMTRENTDKSEGERRKENAKGKNRERGDGQGRGIWLPRANGEIGKTEGDA